MLESSGKGILHDELRDIGRRFDLSPKLSPEGGLFGRPRLKD